MNFISFLALSRVLTRKPGEKLPRKITLKDCWNSVISQHDRYIRYVLMDSTERRTSRIGSMYTENDIIPNVIGFSVLISPIWDSHVCKWRWNEPLVRAAESQS